MNLRPHQITPLARSKEELAAGVNRQVVRMATGTGKTPMFCRLKDALELPGRIMCLTHREELAEQTVRAFAKWNPGQTVGLEMGASKSNGETNIVGSVQTLGTLGNSRISNFCKQDFSAVIVDEAHHSAADTYKRVFDHFDLYSDKTRLLFGVSAHINRADGKGLGDIYQKVIYDYSILNGIKDGWLVDLQCLRFKTGIDITHVGVGAGDFKVGELEKVSNTYARNAFVVQKWMEHAGHLKTLVFAVDIEHAKGLAITFQSFGIRAEAVWGADPDRKEKLKRHRNGQTQVLVNPQFLTEGYDDWEIGCVIPRTTQSESSYVQMIGRGTRIPDGIGNLKEALAKGEKVPKHECLILDFVDNTSKHSLVTIASLHGMAADLDMHGKKMSKIIEMIEEAKAEAPTIDLTELKDITELPSLVEKVNLFQVTFPPEIVQISEFQWHRTAENQYILLLHNEDSVSIKRDILDKWTINGIVSGSDLKGDKDSLEEAVKEADWYVSMLGGRSLKTILKRTAKWHNEDPTPAQIKMCKWMGIPVMAGMTKGQLSQKITKAKAHKLAAKKPAA